MKRLNSNEEFEDLLNSCSDYDDCCCRRKRDHLRVSDLSLSIYESARESFNERRYSDEYSSYDDFRDTIYE